MGSKHKKEDLRILRFNCSKQVHNDFIKNRLIYSLVFDNDWFGHEDYSSARTFLKEQLNDENSETLIKEYEDLKENSILTCYTDGSLREKEGKVTAGGAFLFYNKDKLLYKENFSIDTSMYDKINIHIVEYEALYRSIKYIQDKYPLPTYLTINFLTDSKVMTNQLKLFYRIRNKDVRTLNKKCLEELKVFHSWSIDNIERKENIEADFLAKKVTQ